MEEVESRKPIGKLQSKNPKHAKQKDFAGIYSIFQFKEIFSWSFAGFGLHGLSHFYPKKEYIRYYK